MKHNKGFWYYFSIGGIAFSLGAIIYSIVSGETYVIGKFILILCVSIYFFIRFIRERKAQQQAKAASDQESKNQ